ncbi:MAG: DUF3422 domain-containing protein [Devosia sp.]
MLPDHPDREAIDAELHARPVDIVEATTRVRRLVLLPPSPGQLESLISRFEAFCRTNEIERVPRSVRQTSFTVGQRAVTWEFHTEFATVTWRDSADDKHWPLGIGLESVGDATLIAAMRVDVTDRSEIPGQMVVQFNQSSLCVSTVEDGAAQIATDYLTDEHGYTHIEFAAGSMSPLRRSVLVRRLLEIETYRSMSLLALPLARSTSPSLGDAERELTRVIEALADATTAAAIQSSLDSLHTLSIRSGQLSEVTGYRFAASRAYGRILQSRLDSLREGPTRQGSSIGRYLRNRVDPALSTCLALEKRLETLTAKIERGIELLNVRIGLDLQVQNKAVLDTIASTAQSQFHLQATVEGLSVIAISYYALGILSYALAGPLEMLHGDKTLAISIGAPFAVLAVWWAVRRVRRTHIRR